MSVKPVICLIILLRFSAPGLTQFNETIRTGRPGQAIGPFSVGRYVFQSQAGFNMGGFNISNTRHRNFFIAPGTVLRYGLSRHFEINTAPEFRNDRIKTGDSVHPIHGLSEAATGGRINF